MAIIVVIKDARKIERFYRGCNFFGELWRACVYHAGNYLGFRSAGLSDYSSAKLLLR
jgi:hypothetical protein